MQHDHYDAPLPHNSAKQKCVKYMLRKRVLDSVEQWSGFSLVLFGFSMVWFGISMCFVSACFFLYQYVFWYQHFFVWYQHGISMFFLYQHGF